MDQAHRLPANKVEIYTGRKGRTTGQGKPCRLATRAWRRLGKEQSLGQASRTVEQAVIEDGILIVETGASTDYGLAAASRVPGKTRCRTKVVYGDANLV